jgi:hypothetical protein
MTTFTYVLPLNYVLVYHLPKLAGGVSKIIMWGSLVLFIFSYFQMRGLPQNTDWIGF